MELRRRPPTEQDVNAEAMEVLRSLYWLAVYFRLTARPQDLETTEGACLTGDFSPAIRRWLRNVSGITVHTSIRGQGNGTRNVFERGEIAFSTVGPDTGNLNPHHAG
jgi:hypothetical protein